MVDLQSDSEDAMVRESAQGTPCPQVKPILAATQGCAQNGWPADSIVSNLID